MIKDSLKVTKVPQQWPSMTPLNHENNEKLLELHLKKRLIHWTAMTKLRSVEHNHENLTSSFPQMGQWVKIYVPLSNSFCQVKEKVHPSGRLSFTKHCSMWTAIRSGFTTHTTVIVNFKQLKRIHCVFQKHIFRSVLSFLNIKMYWLLKRNENMKWLFCEVTEKLAPICCQDNTEITSVCLFIGKEQNNWFNSALAWEKLCWGLFTE